MENKEKQYRYIAGGLLAVELIRMLIQAINGSFSFWTVLSLVATALMVAAMFTEKYVLLAVGAGLKLPSSLVSLVSNIRVVFSNIKYFGDSRYTNYALALGLSNILSLAVFVLLLLAVFQRDKAKKLCFTSAGLRVGVFVLTIVSYIIFGVNVRSILRLIPSTLLGCASIVLVGIVMQAGKKCENVSPAVPTAAPVTADTSARIDKLMKLKTLLDNGVLTQEEFDAKKKQLLGQ